MLRAFVFPGQGSQTVGMGKDFYDNFQTARAVFDEVDAILAPFYGHRLSTVIFEGPEEKLMQTSYAQPALMATSMAIYRTLEQAFGKPLLTQAAFMAGHSLGEYSALCAAGVLSLKDTIYLLYHRGKAMAECVPADGGAMAAIIGLDMDMIENITATVGCFIANDNGGSQVVISGEKNAVAKAMEAAHAEGAKRVVALSVSAPFHCPLMQQAADIMQEKINETTFTHALTPVITNVSAMAQTDASTLKAHLIDQICGRVRWRESMLSMAEHGEIKDVYEIGAGKVLTGLGKRITSDLSFLSVSGINDVDIFLRTF